MDAVVLHSPPGLRFPTCSLRRLGKFAVSWRERAPERSWLAPQKGVSWLSTSCIRFDANTRGPIHRIIFASARTDKGDETEISQSFNGKKSKSSDKEEIIALLKRIQSEISKGDSQSTNERSSNLDQLGLPRSILDVHNKSGKQARGKSATRERNKTLTKKGGSKKDQEVLEQSEGTDFQLTRLPSNFVMKSHIPTLSTPRGEVLELNNEASPTIMENKQVQSQVLEEMKIAELRAIAKSRGIKGYSKMKKGELIEILRT